jgi:DNA-binding beta-propeller fold protein YncE
MFLPDGRSLLYWARTLTDEGGGIHIATVGSDAEAGRLLASDTHAIYVAPGYLLFGRESRLYRQRFDVETKRPSGDPVPVVDALRTAPIGLGEFSASSTGLLAYRQGMDASNHFTWVDRNGEPRGTVGRPGRHRTSALSPDGRRLVYTDLGDGNLKIIDVQTQVVTQLTSEAGIETSPVWSADGTKVY